MSTPVDILKTAKLVVEKDGYWTRGSLAKKGSVCMLGAIGVADGLIGFTYQDGKRVAVALDPDVDVTYGTFDPSFLTDEAQKAIEFVSASLKIGDNYTYPHKREGVKGQMARLVKFNDDRANTTKDKVIKAFNRAIKKAEAYGTPSPRAEVEPLDSWMRRVLYGGR